jgi:hypothetical protein
MAKLFITEFKAMENANDIGGVPQIAKLPGVDQVVTFTTSTQSTAFAYNTRFVRVIADADCHIAYGTNPTATTSTMRLSAGVAEYFGVSTGDKIAAVTAS